MACQSAKSVVLSLAVNFRNFSDNHNAGAATRGTMVLQGMQQGPCFVARGGAKHREFYGNLGL